MNLPIITIIFHLFSLIIFNSIFNKTSKIMKTIKFSFLTIIALVSISFTIISSAGRFKNLALLPEDFCYTVISSKLTCQASTVQLSGISCSSATAYVGKPVYSTSTGRIPIIYVPEVCPGGSTFCCAEIEVILSPICVTQPQLDITMTGNKYYKITAVHCQSS